MKKIIDFTGVLEAIVVALRELFPNFGKIELQPVVIKKSNFKQFKRHKS